MALITENYCRLLNQQKRWGINKADLFHAIENGGLRVCVWLPARYIERAVIKKTDDATENLEGDLVLRELVYEVHKPERGFVGLRPEDCRMIFSKGRMKLRKFNSVCQDNQILRLIDEPPQPAISVGLRDIVVLEEDIKKFEALHKIEPEIEINSKKAEVPIFVHANDYHYVILSGEEYLLGDVQANIIEQLHESWEAQSPWVHYKTLLHISGSNATKIQDVFRNQRTWNGLLVSDKRGNYRLNLPFAELQKSLVRKAA